VRTGTKIILITLIIGLALDLTITLVMRPPRAIASEGPSAVNSPAPAEGRSANELPTVQAATPAPTATPRSCSPSSRSTPGDSAGCPECRAETRAVTRSLATLLQRIDARCEEVFRESSESARARDRLRSIPCVGSGPRSDSTSRSPEHPDLCYREFFASGSRPAAVLSRNQTLNSSAFKAGAKRWPWA
jgi:hypothetical protein